MPQYVRMLTPLINIPAGMIFIGGAAYSYLRTRKIYALCITLGAVFPMLGGILARFGFTGLIHLTDLTGTIFLVLGFYLSLRAGKKPERITKI